MGPLPAMQAVLQQTALSVCPHAWGPQWEVETAGVSAASSGRRAQREGVYVAATTAGLAAVGWCGGAFPGLSPSLYVCCWEFSVGWQQCR